ncbi:SEC-C domain-containing protein [Agromyces sp. ISL-38]|uniref:SEC-C domain-containing protein n=1 Tax=Agromyces sp. ISL-38 TaxID=2819107 RepID=UPI001BEAD3E8|nr:SEC-C metal-binding domain-containing protein [Agromyces sp. ISL-38]MBT2499402.1 SEC-C domain-containing protein [Agromyces sp. ISL-38]
MTLGIAFAGRDFAGIVSDRRVSGGGTDPDDEYTKNGVVEFIDARLAYSFTGLARAPTLHLETNLWAAEALCRAGEGRRMRAALDDFAQRCSERFRQLRGVRLADRAATFIFAGYERSAFGALAPVVATVSNLAIGESVGGAFTLALEPIEDGIAVGAIGSGAAHVNQGEITRIVEAVNRSRRTDVLAQMTAEVIKRIAQLEATVGERVTSIIVPPDPTIPCESRYHAATAARSIPLAAHVIAAWDDRGAHIMIDGSTSRVDQAVVSVPNSPRNSPCPCGSGLKYKACHGRRTRPGGQQISAPYTQQIGMRFMILKHAASEVDVMGLGDDGSITVGGNHIAR